MTDQPSPGPPQPFERPSDERLDSWKEIAGYLKRDITTVQRWEKREGMPVHRHVHDKAGSVYAFRTELDAWVRSRNPGLVDDMDRGPQSTRDAAPVPAVRVRGRQPVLWLAGAISILVIGAVAIWQVQRSSSPENPLAEARFLQLTDFAGNESAAALSRDGKFVAFLSDRDGRMDVWVTQVGTGQFYNLTRNIDRELVNPSVRTLGFSPDGTLVTFWTRAPAGATQPDINIWAAPVLGGPPRPYLNGAAEFDWSTDGARLVYHTPGPGDPMFVRKSGDAQDERALYQAPAGQHSHFPLWSPDQQHVYFVQGSLPDRMDIWRIKPDGPDGGQPERITSHESVVSHPVFLDERTLLYLATDSEGSGPWIYDADVQRRISRRVSVGINRYTSLAASADGRRIVATQAARNGVLWRFPITGAAAEISAARRIPLTTGSGSSPRLGADYLLYVTSKGESDSIWKLQGDAATELWSASETRIIGGPAIAQDGRRIAFSIRQNGRTLLYVLNGDGTDARIITRSLELRGAPAWAPDGLSITVAAVSEGATQLFNVPLDGGEPSRFISEHSSDPVWSPDGEIVVFSGADIGTTFPVRAATRHAMSHALPKITLTRGARRLAFMPKKRALVVMRGDLQRKNLWLVDLETGSEQQLTNLPSDFEMRDFGISPDGRELVVEQVLEHSDIVLLER